MEVRKSKSLASYAPHNEARSQNQARSRRLNVSVQDLLHLKEKAELLPDNPWVYGQHLGGKGGGVDASQKL